MFAAQRKIYEADQTINTHLLLHNYLAEALSPSVRSYAQQLSIAVDNAIMEPKP
jgi:hypothetical protein